MCNAVPAWRPGCAVMNEARDHHGRQVEEKGEGGPWGSAGMASSCLGRRGQGESTSPAFPYLVNPGPTSHFIPRLGRQRRTSPAGLRACCGAQAACASAWRLWRARAPDPSRCCPGWAPASSHASRRHIKAEGGGLASREGGGVPCGRRIALPPHQRPERDGGLIGRLALAGDHSTIISGACVRRVHGVW